MLLIPLQTTASNFFTTSPCFSLRVFQDYPKQYLFCCFGTKRAQRDDGITSLFGTVNWLQEEVRIRLGVSDGADCTGIHFLSCRIGGTGLGVGFGAVKGGVPGATPHSRGAKMPLVPEVFPKRYAPVNAAGG